MRVRILHGNQAGAEVDMGRPEAETAIASGFARALEERPEVVADAQAQAYAAGLVVGDAEKVVAGLADQLADPKRPDPAPEAVALAAADAEKAREAAAVAAERADQLAAQALTPLAGGSSGNGQGPELGALEGAGVVTIEPGALEVDGEIKLRITTDSSGAIASVEDVSGSSEKGQGPESGAPEGATEGDAPGA